MLFRGIEGVRAWLAWIVVCSHIILLSGAVGHLQLLKIFGKMGEWSVSVFIIISGFVITNLILTRKEKYPLYIARRFLRIYPVYLICLILGVVCFLSWGGGTSNSILLVDSRHFSDQANEIAEGRGLWHILAHLSLFHGAIPNNILRESQYIFLAPAWSLSLEWQFYLIAPLVVAGFLNKKFALWVVLAVGMFFVVYQKGYFGEFYLPSLIFGAGPMFLVGIGTRFIIDKIKPLEAYPIAFVIGVVILGYWSTVLIPVAAWIALVCYFLLSDDALKNPDFYTKTIRLMIDSPLAQAAGSRSYSVYILHWVVINFILHISLVILHQTDFWTIFLTTCLGSVGLTLLGSEILYRFVEKPSIALGKKLSLQKKDD